MKIVLTTDHYPRMFNLGVELWFPNRPKHWKRFSIKLMMGPFCVEMTLGSKKIYDEMTELLRSK